MKNNFGKLLLALTILIFASCNNIFMQDASYEPGMGYVILSFTDNNARRLIVPENLNQSAFTMYDLLFTSPGQENVAKNGVLPANITDQIGLKTGTWELTITAYIGNNVSARGVTPNIVINESTSTSVPITLNPIIEGTGTGTFSWDIIFANNVTGILGIEGSINITRYGGTSSVQPLSFTSAQNMTGSITREIGYYQVILTLTRGEQKIEYYMVLYVYQNMTSKFTYTFTEDNFNNPQPFLGIQGSGTASDPYQMSTHEDFIEMAMVINSGVNHFRTANYKLMNNIYTNSGMQWIPIGTEGFPFNGKFDGNGHTISGLYISNSNNDVGMFSYIDTNGIVENLGLLNADIKGGSWVGAIAGDNGGIIQNCYAKGDVNGVNSVGGLAGFNTGSIINSFITGNVTGNNQVGGLVARNVGDIINSYIIGIVSGGSGRIGGMAGFNSGNIQKCFFSGTITGGLSVGGITGESNLGIIENCYVNADISGISDVGGIVGLLASGTVRNCYTIGTINGTNVSEIDGVGGIAGFNNSTIQNCVALTGRVTASNNITNVGRIIGAPLSTTGLSNNYAFTDMIIRFNWTGGSSGNLIQLEISHNMVDGASIDFSHFKNQTWWSNTSNWTTAGGASAWNFSASGPWQWNSVTRLPVLRNMPGNPAQNWDVITNEVQVITEIAGLGTLSDPYQISTQANLTRITEIINDPGSNSYYRNAHYTLMNNITLTGYQTPIGMAPKEDAAIVVIPFTGNFNGNGYVITNMTIPRNSNDNGMFQLIGPGGVVRNLGLENISVGTWSIGGGIAGTLDGGRIYNCYVKGTIFNGYNIGGIVGRISNNGIVENTFFNGTVGSTALTGSLGQNSGGIAGAIDVTGGSIINCYSVGSIQAVSAAGGIVGNNNGGIIEYCYAIVNIEITLAGDAYKSIGGIAGVHNNTDGTNTLIRNSVALNASLTANPVSLAMRRVVGAITDSDIPDNRLLNNYGRSGMILTPNRTINPGLEMPDGADAASAEYNTQSWWAAQSNWDGAAWNFSAIWEWRSGANGLPVLRNMPGNPSQNHTVP